MIAAGNDERLGIAAGQPDHLPSPSAINYWTQEPWLTGGESLAYMLHHFLTRRLVIPIPNIWMIVLAIILGKITVIVINNQPHLNSTRRQQIRTASAGAVILYGMTGLQVYISAGVLVPWLLPSSVFLAYVLSATKRQNSVAE
ncbi:hypothetical protein [Fischerella thermalis]|uniref:hypothetical protein n=1 Tax=Fischerella thermalis TaxID=372787 RepID=UPI002155D32C|nr:hypothetical protein [Fischerella thermalis]